MISKEEIEKAKDILLRGNDIESACLIMQEVVWGKLVQVGGRVNIVKIAMRQILNFIEEYKDKGYIDIIREKVQLKEKNKQLEQENKELLEIKDMKESIELANMNIKSILRFKYDNEKLQSKVKQLEQEKQKLIEELEKRRDNHKENFELAVKLKDEHAKNIFRGKYDEDDYILKQYFEKKVEGK